MALLNLGSTTKVSPAIVQVWLLIADNRCYGGCLALGFWRLCPRPQRQLVA